MMKLNKWTVGLTAAGLVSSATIASADEAAKPSPVLTALSSTTLSGYVSASAVWNPSRTPGFVPGLVQNVGGVGYQDGFNLDVVSLTLDKPITDSGWGAGYHVQMLFGPGANQRGSFLVSQAASDFGFNEAYISLRVPVGNGIQFDIGQFGTYNGYEAYDVYKNPNFTKSFGFYNETSAHTGIKATYKFSDIVTLSGAVANTGSAANGTSSRVDSRATVQSKKAYLGMLTLTAPESMGFLKGGSLSFGALTGPGDATTAVNATSTQQYYVGGSAPTPIKGLTMGFGYDYTLYPIGGGLTGRGTSIAGYLQLAATEKLKINSRFDYGTGSAGWYYAGPKPQKVMSVTETFDYSLWANVISRFEVRWDHCVDGAKPYSSGSRQNNVLLIANVIYLF